MQKPENAFHRIRACKPKPACLDCVESCGFPRTRRTVLPSTHPRSASGGATDFLPASALDLPTDLAIDRQGRRAMRRTDVCHPIESRAPAPRSFPVPCTPCEAWTPRGGFGSAQWMTGGPGVSRRLRPLRRIVARHMYCAPFAFRLGAAAWAFSSHGAVCDRASGTPVAILPVSRLSRLHGSCVLAARPRISRGLARVGRPSNRRDRPPAPLVKGTRSKRPGIPSIIRDPSQDPVVVTTPVPRRPHRFWRWCHR